MSEGKIIIAGSSGSFLAEAIAALAERGDVAQENVIVIRKPPPIEDLLGFPETNRAERRRYNSKRKHLKGLRP